MAAAAAADVCLCPSCVSLFDSFSCLFFSLFVSFKLRRHVVGYSLDDDDAKEEEEEEEDTHEGIHKQKHKVGK